MLKKILFTIVIASLFAQISVSATHEKGACENTKLLEELIPFLFERDDTTISRGDCIASLMKIIGVDEITAMEYASADYCVMPFSDLASGDTNVGYVIVSKFSNVSVGIKRNRYDTIHAFCATRPVTVKESLTFMLRCLKDTNFVAWENTMTDSVEVGLLQEDEISWFEENAPLLSKDFRTLLSRMLNMRRYLYWPTEAPRVGHTRSMQVDKTNSIRYIDWILLGRQGTDGDEDRDRWGIG